MPSCAFRKCTNYGGKINKDKGISYHRFPSDEVNLQDWITVVRVQKCEHDWMPSKSSRICSNHFREEDKYKSQKGLTLLKKNAVPILEEHKEDKQRKNLGSITIPDAKEFLETPKTAALKKIARKLKFDKCAIQYKNKLLSQQNKRLKKNIAKTTRILKILKKRNYISNEKNTEQTELKTKQDLSDMKP